MPPLGRVLPPSTTATGASMDEISAPRIVEVDPSKNLNDLLATRVAADPSAPMVERPTGPGGAWEALSAREFDAEVVAVAKGLVARSIQPGDHVGIMSRTRYEWTLLDWASWAAGAVPVPLYETSSPEQVQWILSDADVRLVVVAAEAHAATVAEVRDDAPSLEHVLVVDSGAVATLVAEGADVDDAEIARRREIASLADVATIIYTSGTTGRPKGAELTHENFYSLTVNAVAAVPEVFGEPGGRTLLFMPLAHVFARFIGVLVVAGGTVLGHTPDTKTLLDDLGTFKPTYILSVPRVFEKVYNSSEQKAAAGGKLKIFHWAAATAIAYSRALGERLGHFYRGIGVRILEGYGLTESTAPTSVNRPGNTKIGTVGEQLPGCGARIAEDGEI